jgi:hypothetical protein
MVRHVHHETGAKFRVHRVSRNTEASSSTASCAADPDRKQIHLRRHPVLAEDVTDRLGNLRFGRGDGSVVGIKLRTLVFVPPVRRSGLRVDLDDRAFTTAAAPTFAFITATFTAFATLATFATVTALLLGRLNGRCGLLGLLPLLESFPRRITLRLCVATKAALAPGV